ncbi:phage baseplate assembly protein V [Vibrio alginolyticus]|uniref:phage baseplate assembly protein V n=1 Tax=Vibrio alginolyticus TaxID=663 RepID=UPI00215C02E6|nr:phage baseplate assembly protein V [Vibrio alginolyticus]MCR9529240.1 phage baseplate assembly protein V [Vibrio alginolyticus]
MSDLPYIVRDLQRRMANMIRRGRVHSVDFEQSPPRVKVEYEKGAVTGWLPWISGRESNKHRTDWEPLAIGEQVIILSESGDLSAGVVLPSLPDATSPVPSTSPDEHVSRYEDGTTFTYNRKTHTLSIDVQGDAILHTTGNVTANIKGTADVTVAKDLTLKTNTNMVLDASGNIDIKAGGNVKVTGTRIDLN